MSPILPKNERENSKFCLSLLGQKFFVRFLGELKKLKSRFEINWPLVSHMTTKGLKLFQVAFQLIIVCVANSSDIFPILDFCIYQYFWKNISYYLFFNFQTETKSLFWTNKDFFFFFNCSNWEEIVEKISESNWWKHLMNSKWNIFIHDQIKSNSNSLGFRKKLHTTHSFLYMWKI